MVLTVVLLPAVQKIHSFIYVGHPTLWTRSELNVSCCVYSDSIVRNVSEVNIQTVPMQMKFNISRMMLYKANPVVFATYC
tara:strand:+ start:218 stop:457 length:240 start_codon:yes stop_codon:yes gene_type:complete